MLPLCGAMALCLPLVVHRCSGRPGAASGQAAEPLIALMAMLCLMFPAGVAVVARGQTGRALAGNVACLLLTLAGVVWLRPASAVQAVLVWCGAQALVTPYALWINGSAVGTGLLRPLRGGVVTAGIAAVGLATSLAVPAGESLLGLAVRAAVFGAIVAGGVTGSRRVGAKIQGRLVERCGAR